MENSRAINAARIPRALTSSASLLTAGILGFGVFYVVTMGMAAMAGLAFSDFNFAGS